AGLAAGSVGKHSGPPHPWLPELIGRTAGVQLFADERYLFETHILAGPTWHDGEQLTLSAPSVVQVVQRRRFWRAQLAPSTQVTLRWRNGGRPRHFTCPLLHVSAEGLACKVDACLTQSLAIGAQVSCDFRLPGSPRELQFDAVVRNCSPASDETWIVGIEFDAQPIDPESAAALQELRDVLYRPQFNLTGAAAP